MTFERWLSLRKVCKTFHAILDPKSEHGAFLWKCFRTRLGYPDPVPIGISDYQFFTAYFGQGCNFCEDHPTIRDPIWQFGGKRFCKDCLLDHTVERWKFHGFRIECHVNLPSVHRYDRQWFLRSDYERYGKIVPSKTILLQLEEQRDAVHKFVIQLEVLAKKAAIEKKKSDDILRAQRKESIQKLLNEERPCGLLPITLSRMTCVISAIERTTNFNKSARTKLLQNITEEYFDNCKYYIDCHLKDFIDIIGGELGLVNINSDVLQIMHMYDCTNFDHVPTDEQVTNLVERANLRWHWIRRCRYLETRRKLINSASFKSANQNDDQQVCDFIDQNDKRCKTSMGSLNISIKS